MLMFSDAAVQEILIALFTGRIYDLRTNHNFMLVQLFDNQNRLQFLNLYTGCQLLIE